MLRERATKVALAVVGLIFTAGIIPIVMSLRNLKPLDYGDDMMLSIYVALGIFLLLAVRNPSANRSLIAFTAWSSFAHAAVMAAMAAEVSVASDRRDFLGGVAIFAVIGLIFIVLAPARAAGTRAAAA